MLIRAASVSDLKAIDALRRADQEAVGFLPMSRFVTEVEHAHRTLLTLIENNDIVGYAFWTRGWPIARIQQIVVRPDARREERATALVRWIENEAKTQHRYGLSCRCRLNLEAAHFWRSLGFREVRLEESGRRGPVLRFYKELFPALLDLGLYMPTPAFGTKQGQRQGFRVVKAAGAVLDGREHRSFPA